MVDERNPSPNRRPRRVQKPVPSGGVGDALAEMIPHWALKVDNESCGCRRWRDKMNGWGAHGCEVHRLEIVTHLMSQSKHLIPILGAMPDALKKAAANRMLTAAIKKASTGSDTNP